MLLIKLLYACAIVKTNYVLHVVNVLFFCSMKLDPTMDPRGVWPPNGFCYMSSKESNNYSCWA